MAPPDARRRRVFDSVFAPPEFSQPTPTSTPASNFSAPGEAFGGPLRPSESWRQGGESFVSSDIRSKYPGNPITDRDVRRDQVHWDRAWHLVTATLKLPPISRDAQSPSQLFGTRYLESPNDAFSEALRDLLNPQERVQYASFTEDIIQWYANHVRLHFLHKVLPLLLSFGSDDAPEVQLFRCTKILEASHRQYLHGLSLIVEELEALQSGSSQPVIQKFRRDLHAIIYFSLMETLSTPIKSTLRRYVFTVLGLPTTLSSDEVFARVAENEATEVARTELLRLIEQMRNIGLTGEKFQVSFAEVMNSAMEWYVYKGCKELWSEDHTDQQNRIQDDGSVLPRAAHHGSPSYCVTELCKWIEERYSKLAVQVLDKISQGENKDSKVTWAQVEKWKEMGIGHIADLRTLELFDVVSRWPNANGALEDLRTAITTPQRRLHLTDVFAETMTKKILHPGASTLSILQVYISMIRSFHALDHSKVLLDRVAYPLQLYLCSREDTVRIVIIGLLADTEDMNGDSIELGSDKLNELAHLLNNGEEVMGSRASDEELDWHDLDWMPDPVDAGPGYKRSKSADIIGTLIRVLGAQEIFIKEFQNIIGENLLKQDGRFEKEVKVLELLKARFGEAALQSCEVMLKDIKDSERVNAVIRGNQKLDPSEEEMNAAQMDFDMGEGYMKPEGRLKPSLNAKILSRLFWPQLHDESFHVPSEIETIQQMYEKGFERLKSKRKLTWLPALGQATVELELQDRKILEEVHTWQATVIWAFQSPSPLFPNAEGKRSVEELAEKLEMEEALVRSALKFWVNKLVLQEVEKDIFIVLETLNNEDRARSDAQAASHAAGPADDGADDDAAAALMGGGGIATETRQMYWQFIHGMLKNASSQMPLQQIAMMLKMLLPDGFPHSNDELQEILHERVEAGELDFGSGKYKLRK